MCTSSTSSHRSHNAKPVSTMLRTQKWYRSQSPVLWECGQLATMAGRVECLQWPVWRTLAAPTTHTHTGNLWRMPSRRADADCTRWATSPLSLGSTLTNVIGDTVELCIHVCSGYSWQVPTVFSILRAEPAICFISVCTQITSQRSALCPSQAYGSSEEAGPCSRNPAILNNWG